MSAKAKVFIVLLIGLMSLTACKNNTPVPTNIPVDVPSMEAPAVMDTETTLPTEVPTATPVPLPAAATVNGEPIFVADYEEEYERFLVGAVASGVEYDEVTGRAIVLEDMIVTLLLAQGARDAGYELTDAAYTERLNYVISEAGGEAVFQDWLVKNKYTAESFKRLYWRSLEAEWMKQQLFSEIPLEVDHIRARQIMVQTSALAESIYAQLEAGADFATIAWLYDPISGGELGWFPQHYLVLKEVEDAVFLLEAGQYTPVLETEYGYQIIQVMERGPRHLTQDAMISYQNRILSEWVSKQKNQSDLVILTD